MKETVFGISWDDDLRAYRAQIEANRIKYAPKIINKFDLEPVCKFRPRKGQRSKITYRDYAIYQYSKILLIGDSSIALIFGLSSTRIRQIIDRIDEKLSYSRVRARQYNPETKSIDPTIGPMNYGEWQAWDAEAQWREITAPEGPPN